MRATPDAGVGFMRRMPGKVGARCNCRSAGVQMPCRVVLAARPSLSEGDHQPPCLQYHIWKNHTTDALYLDSGSAPRDPCPDFETTFPGFTQPYVNRGKVVSMHSENSCNFNELFWVILGWEQGSRENRGKIPRNLGNTNRKARRGGLVLHICKASSGGVFRGD